MKSPFWKTYAALGLLAALGAYIWFVERERDPNAGEKLFTALDTEAVHEVRIAGGDETIRLAREDGKWRIAEPLQVEADEAAVTGLIKAVERLTVDETLAGSGSRSAKDFGLDPPRRVVTLLGEGGAELARVELGAPVTGGGLIYARAPGRPDVITLESGIDSITDKKAFDFRDRNVLHVARDEIRGLDVSGPEGDYALRRDGESWAFTRPLRTLAGRWNVDSLLGLVSNLTMTRVAAEEPGSLAEYGLDPPARRLTVTLPDDSTRTLEIGKPAEDGTYYVRNAARPLVAVVPQALVQDLEKGMGELRADRLMDVSTYDVTGFTVTLDGQERVWARSSAKGEEGFDAHTWKRTVPDEKELTTSDVEDALFKVSGLEVKGFLDTPGADAEYGLDAPQLVIAVRTEARPEVEMRVGRHGEACYARRPDDDSVLQLDCSAVDGVREALGKI